MERPHIGAGGGVLHEHVAIMRVAVGDNPFNAYREGERGLLRSERPDFGDRVQRLGGIEPDNEENQQK